MNELAVESLRIDLAAGRRRWVEVVRGVSLRVRRGEAVGLVGESGSGKSLLARSLLGLLPPVARVAAGRIRIDGSDLRIGGAPSASRVGLVLQEPSSALNPVLTVGAQLGELLAVHRGLRGRAARDAASELLGMVALPGGAATLRAFPHQLSGGQRQRVLLALALAADPLFLVADEPTTALDVTVQAQILGLLERLRRDLDLGILLISHDLAVIAESCSRAYVIYCGEIVEEGPVDGLFAAPLHPYTRALLASRPVLGRPSPRGRLPTIAGSVPDPSTIPGGCPFHPRCPAAVARCTTEPASWIAAGDERGGRCHLITPEDAA